LELRADIGISIAIANPNHFDLEMFGSRCSRIDENRDHAFAVRVFGGEENDRDFPALANRERERVRNIRGILG